MRPLDRLAPRPVARPAGGFAARPRAAVWRTACHLPLALALALGAWLAPALVAAQVEGNAHEACALLGGGARRCVDTTGVRADGTMPALLRAPLTPRAALPAPGLSLGADVFVDGDRQLLSVPLGWTLPFGEPPVASRSAGATDTAGGGGDAEEHGSPLVSALDAFDDDDFRLNALYFGVRVPFLHADPGGGSGYAGVGDLGVEVEGRLGTLRPWHGTVRGILKAPTGHASHALGTNSWDVAILQTMARTARLGQRDTIVRFRAGARVNDFTGRRDDPGALEDGNTFHFGLGWDWSLEELAHDLWLAADTDLLVAPKVTTTWDAGVGAAFALPGDLLAFARLSVPLTDFENDRVYASPDRTPSGQLGVRTRF